MCDFEYNLYVLVIRILMFVYARLIHNLIIIIVMGQRDTVKCVFQQAWSVTIFSLPPIPSCFHVGPTGLD